MAVGEEEWTLTEMMEYVGEVTMQLAKHGLSVAQVQQIIDGYSPYIREEWDEGTPSDKLAEAFLTMHRRGVPMVTKPKPLFKMSQYVAHVVAELGNFGFDLEDSLGIVDDFDTALLSWFPLVPPRVAARRLGVMENRLKAGLALHEGR